MWRLLLRFRLLLWLLRFVIYPLVVLTLLLFVFLTIGVSLYFLVIAKTLLRVPENPYLYVPLLLLELSIIVLGSYYAMVYINRIFKNKRETGGR